MIMAAGEKREIGKLYRVLITNSAPNGRASLVLTYTLTRLSDFPR